MRIMINGRCLEGKRTGVGRYLSNLLRIWGSEYKSNYYDIYFRNEFSNDSFLEEDNISASLVPNSKLFDLGPVWENFYLPRALRKNKQAEVYFSPLYTLPIYPLKCKQVVTIFDISYIAHPEWFPKKQLASINTLTGPTVRKADIILTGSEATKKEIIKYFNVKDEKIYVTNLGVDKKFIDMGNSNSKEFEALVRKKYKLSGKVVLFVGLIMNRRNLPALMEAVSRVIKKTSETITLVVIGKNHTYPFYDINELAEQHNITKNFRWVTYTSDEEIYGFYKSADVFVCSSLYEGFNITPLEALYLDVPVICSNLSSLPEVVGDAAYYLEDPKDPKEIADALENVLFDADLQADLLKKGNIQAKKFSWDRCASETIEIIESIN